MSEINKSDGGTDTSPGYVCPFCDTDCSPISGSKCEHLFLIDGENGWRFTAESQKLFDSASQKGKTIFRDLLYHDPECREFLRLRRANYEDSLEIYVFSQKPNATVRAFEEAILRG